MPLTIISRLQGRVDADQRRAEGPVAGPSSMTMWVDKYRPKKFSDLLGEDVSWKLSLPIY